MKEKETLLCPGCNEPCDLLFGECQEPMCLADREPKTVDAYYIECKDCECSVLRCNSDLYGSKEQMKEAAKEGWKNLFNE